jgi:hypothetical protein
MVIGTLLMAVFIALATHRIVFGQWRGSKGRHRRRSMKVVVVTLVGWIVLLGVVWSVWPSWFGGVFVATALVMCSMLAGCAEDYGVNL